MSSDPPSTLVERRLRYIERQRGLQREAAARDAAVTKPMGTGPLNRHGMPTVPTGQRVVPNWPVLDLGDTPDVSRADWQLEVGGLCEHPLSFTWDEFLALPQADDEQRLPLRDHLEPFEQPLAQASASGPWPSWRCRPPMCGSYPARATTWPRAPTIPYTTNLALARAVEDDVLLVHTWEGHPLPREHGGPCRMITPQLYAWKGTKWIRRIQFLAEDRPGFWEVRGYSNTAEPWLDDRYAD